MGGHAKTKFLFVGNVCMLFHCLVKRILINWLKHLSLHKENSNVLTFSSPPPPYVAWWTVLPETRIGQHLSLDVDITFTSNPLWLLWLSNIRKSWNFMVLYISICVEILNIAEAVDSKVTSHVCCNCLLQEKKAPKWNDCELWGGGDPGWQQQQHHAPNGWAGCKHTTG